jgi:hypothetical protein
MKEKNIENINEFDRSWQLWLPIMELKRDV